MAKQIFNVSSRYNVIAAIVAGGLLGVILIVSLLVVPAWNRLQELGREVPVEQQKRDQAEQDLENLKDAKQFFEEQATDVERVNLALPVRPEVPTLLAILESLAIDSGVYLDGFTPQQLGAAEAAAQAQAEPTADAAPGGVDSLEVTANFSGTYSSLLNFLYSLERSLRIVDVKVINVSAVEDTGAITGSISFRTYYKTVEGSAPAGADAAADAPDAAAPAEGGAQ
ncbi:MAG: type 4a pilus biogenesis protein PilO [bacterium]|nr:type 4a pilus biogenesis protein PilO [bacterium]